LLILSSVVLPFFSHPVLAEPVGGGFFEQWKDQRALYMSSDGYYDYEPVNNCVDPEPINGNKVTIIGDSLSVGAIGEIQRSLPGIDFDSYDSLNVSLATEGGNQVQSSKQFSGTFPGNASGTQIAKSLADNDLLRDYVVFALGTNGTGSVDSTSIEEVVNIIGPDRKLLLVTNYQMPGVATGSFKDYTSNNEAMKTAATGNLQIGIADWYEVAGAKNGTTEPYVHDNDGLGVHLTDAGKTGFAQTLYDGLKTIWSDGSDSGGSSGPIDWTQVSDVANSTEASDRANIVVNYLLSTDFVGNGNKPLNKIQAAAAIAAIATESGHSFDPEIESSLGYKGIVQWGPGRYAGISDPKTDLNNQLDHIRNELDNAFNGAMSEFWEATSEQDLAKALYAWIRNYEIAIINGGGPTSYAALSGDPTSYIQYWPLERAQAVLEALGGHSGNICPTGDGWLDDLPGISREEFSWPSDGNSGFPFAAGQPTKIILHSTEGTNWPSYDCGPGCGGQYNTAPHFTIDVVTKEIHQHFPLTVMAGATVAGDQQSIQIEIKGFSRKTQDSINLANTYPAYDLQKYSDEQWDYLVVLLRAINRFTGIPLTVSPPVDFSNPTRISTAQFDSYRGVLGHMHITGDDHVDPGDIWDKISARL